jgi:folate-dependent tRNA-U54 methylase TrmFO/GidA
VKVFSTTLARDRDALSDRVTAWLRQNPQVEVVDTEVTQSSDKEFHCLSIIFFFRER